MKKNLLALALAFGISSAAFSQTIPNGGFENWTTTPYGYPTFYLMQPANAQSIKQIGQIVTTQVADPFHGTSAVKVETKTNGIDTVFGYFINGMPCGPSNPNPGGIPYNQNPTGMTGHFKCGVMPGDTALLFVVLKKNGLTLPNGFVFKKFYGTQSSYAAFTMPISVSTAPDTVIIGAASSNVAAGNFQGIPGSFLQLDSINFKGVATQPLNMNGSFELWNTVNYYQPNNWQTAGDSVGRSTSANSGSYAILLQVSKDGGGCGGGSGYNNSEATTGQFTKTSIKGGRPYTLMNDSLVGYYKFTPNGGDTASISWCASKLGVNVNCGYLDFKASTSGVYKRFSTPITLSSAPDSLRIDMQSGRWPVQSSMVGSKIWFDDLQLKSQPLAVPTLYMNPDHVTVYPNPSKGIFNLMYDTDSNMPVNLEVINEVGQVVMKKELQGQGLKNQIDLTTFGGGLYLLKAEQEGKFCTTRILIQ